MATRTVDHIKRAKAAWPILVKRASSGAGPMSYGELCAQIGVHHRAASYFLGVIQRYCLENSLPKLQALAVNKRTGVPGGGYIGKRGIQAHKREVALVNEHVWPRRAPRFP